MATIKEYHCGTIFVDRVSSEAETVEVIFVV